VWNPQEHPGTWRAIWQYSAKRARRDQQTLYAQEARARAVIAGERAAKSTRFVKVTADARTLDEASLARAQSLVGLKGYVSNIGADVMPAPEVIGKYHDLWHVEKAFRMSKTDLRARPMFHRTREAIEAHLTIVFTALAVAHRIQECTGLAIAKIVKQLRPLRSATIVINGTTQTFPPEIPDPPKKNPRLPRRHAGVLKSPNWGQNESSRFHRPMTTPRLSDIRRLRCSRLDVGPVAGRAASHLACPVAGQPR
jgi:hypothetical protein